VEREESEESKETMNMIITPEEAQLRVKMIEMWSTRNIFKRGKKIRRIKEERKIMYEIKLRPWWKEWKEAK
jgi:hypothetical protein